MRNSGRKGDILRTVHAATVIQKQNNDQMCLWIVRKYALCQNFLKEISLGIKGWISERIFEQGCWWQWVLSDPFIKEAGK